MPTNTSNNPKIKCIHEEIPKELIHNTPAEFISHDNDPFCFPDREILISNEIEELAKKHPGEEFIEIILNIDAYGSFIKIVSYKGEDAEQKFNHHCPYNLSESIGEEMSCCFMKNIKLFFESIKDFFYAEWDDENLKKNDNEVIRTQLEDMYFRVMASRECYSYIRILGYYKVTQLPT